MPDSCVLQVTNVNKLQFQPDKDKTDEAFVNFNANMSPNHDPLGQIETEDTKHKSYDHDEHIENFSFPGFMTANQPDQLIANVRNSDCDQRNVFTCYSQAAKRFC